MFIAMYTQCGRETTPLSARSPLFICYRAPAVSDFHDLANTPPFTLSPTSNSLSTTDIKLTERPTSF